MKNKKNVTIADFIFLGIWPAIVTLVSWLSSFGFAVNSLLLFGGISLYLAYKNRPAAPRALIFSVVFAFAGSFIIDYYGHLDGAWYIPTIFSLRIFGWATIEGLLWAFLLTFSIIMLYEHLFDHSRHKLLGHRMAYFIPAALSILVIFVLTILFFDKAFSISYLYVKWMVFMLIATILFILFFPRFLTRLAIIAAYFFAVGMIQEIIALTKGYWLFPGQNFIGWINIGPFSFPYEELLFWLFIFSTATVAYFEFFDDNRLKFKPSRLIKK